MPLTHFNCPDGVTRSIIGCWEHCERPEGRCLSLPTLREVGRSREWKGTPSTTQLLNPTRMEYLKITKPYAIEPESMAFALLGTRHHQRLEAVAKQIEELVAERQLGGEISGILDLLEPDEMSHDKWKLIDYKTWGSYALAKRLNGDVAELEHDALQLNHYRVKVEQLGFPVSRMMIQCTVRDGHTKSAYANGIQERLLMLPVDILDDFEVIEYFCRKSEALCDAVNDNVMPELCDYQERWTGRRCKGFCEVARYCPEGAAVNKVELEG